MADPKPTPDVPLDFVRDCYEANTLGDGILYANLNKGRFIYCPQMAQWFEWHGHHWREDYEARHLSAVERVVEQYIPLADEVQEAITKKLADLESKYTELTDSQKQKALKPLWNRLTAIKNRIDRLRDSNRRKNCVEFAWTCPDDPLVVSEDMLDRDPFLLACENGVIDLRTGELQDGKPEDYITKSCATEYRGPMERHDDWEKFIYEVVGENLEVAQFLQRFYGCSLLGEFREKVFLILTGTNDNGKGVLTDSIHMVLGDYSTPIPVEMLLQKGNNKSSSGPSPDLMALRAARFAYASEPSRRERISDGKVKWLTGGDPISARAPHAKKQISFFPTHTLSILTNDIPAAPWDDDAYWSRAKVVEFPYCYVDQPNPEKPNERRRDPRLPTNLRKNMPGILAWMVRGCIAYLDGGLKPPAEVLNVTIRKRDDDDDLQPWLDECVVRISGRTSSQVLYDSFTSWWKRNVSAKPPKRNTWGKWMRVKGYQKERSSIVYYLGIGVLSTEVV